MDTACDERIPDGVRLGSDATRRFIGRGVEGKRYFYHVLLYAHATYLIPVCLYPLDRKGQTIVTVTLLNMTVANRYRTSSPQTCPLGAIPHSPHRVHNNGSLEIVFPH